MTSDVCLSTETNNLKDPTESWVVQARQTAATDSFWQNVP